MPEGYRQLARDERCQIHALKASGLSDGITTVPGPNPPFLGCRKPRLPAIPSALAPPPAAEMADDAHRNGSGIVNRDECRPKRS